MDKLRDYFPMWDKLTPDQQQTLTQAAVPRSAPQGTALHNGSADCVGLLVVRTGQLRAYVLSDGVIAVSPVFQSLYSGLFKSFIDVLPEGTLRGVPVLLALSALQAALLLHGRQEQLVEKTNTTQPLVKLE